MSIIIIFFCKLHSVELDGENVINVCWTYEGDTQEHDGHFHSDWLKENSYSAEKVEESHRDTKPLIAVSFCFNPFTGHDLASLDPVHYVYN